MESIKNINDQNSEQIRSKSDGFFLDSRTVEKYHFEKVDVEVKDYTPREILDKLCNEVFKENVNALLVVNNKLLGDKSVPTPQYLARLGKSIYNTLHLFVLIAFTGEGLLSSSR